MAFKMYSRKKRVGSPPAGVVRRFLCGAAIAVIATLGFVTPSFADCTMTLRWDDDPPYFMDHGGEVIGIDADISREVMRRLGCRLSLVKLPWARALLELLQGRLGMLSGAYRTPDREQYAYYSSVVGLVSPNILFTRQSDKTEFEFAELREVLGSGFKLGVQIDVSYSKEYDALVGDPAYEKNLEYVSQRELLWRMLARNRVDGVIANELTGLYEVQKLGFSSLIGASSIVVSNEPAYFIFSKKLVTPEFVERFDRALQSMLDDGSFQAIVQRYVCTSAAKNRATQNDLQLRPLSCEPQKES
ncbi:substrate-binding periplasmic protein [Marinobacter sp. F4206]|uniref:substrate-binding periplasmic protein n=1 Tax=Marinobacter sp. F4206 TaxID=2861777 RepID=UPI001C5FADB5|nr:transporter substrate-binding domain-containing protein [Marinobacter sp. F4206]MBW4935544.1 transporter substrate-binding domain-containing protein [Marinobacter sp. F4206]